MSVDELVSIATQEFWARVSVSKGVHRFIVARLGSSGSTFFAHLLNSHPEVNCVHEGILTQVFPSMTLGQAEYERYAGWLAWDTQHFAYRALGDVGSLPLDFVIAAPRENFRTGVLLRHPINVLKTKLHILQTDRSDLPQIVQSDILRHVEIDFDQICDEDLYFLWNASQLAKMLDGARFVDQVVHAERLRSLDDALNVLYTLTGVEYVPEVVADIIGRSVNSKSASPRLTTGDVLSGFTRQQREWYDCIVGERAAAVGYT